MDERLNPYAVLKRKFEQVKTYPVPNGIKPSTDPNVYRGDLLMNWIQSKTSKQLAEITELENLASLLKGDERQKVWKKILQGKKLSNNDLSYVRMMMDILEKLHKLKYGEKRVNVNTSFKDIREMMFGGENGVSPQSDGG